MTEKNVQTEIDETPKKRITFQRPTKKTVLTLIGATLFGAALGAGAVSKGKKKFPLEDESVEITSTDDSFTGTSTES